MRHRKGFNHLSRTSAHRKAMMANMASSLILHKRIRTTTAKAKALRTYVEPLITKSKEDSTHSRRVVFSYLQDKNAVSELFREISPKIMERPGGYTRILKIGNRLGDNADMCIIELVDYNENLLETQEAAKTKSARRRRGKKKTADQAPAVEAAEETVVDQSEETGVDAEAPAQDVAEEVKATDETAMTGDDTAEQTEQAEKPEAQQPEAVKTTQEPADDTPVTEEKKQGGEKNAEKSEPASDTSVEAKSSAGDKVQPDSEVKDETKNTEKKDTSAASEEEDQDKK